MNHQNVVKKFTYWITSPLARGFIKINVSANNVTFLSFLSSVVAGYFLVYKENILFFIIFWLLNIILDFTDGAVARGSKKDRINGVLRVDHLTDLIKFGIIWIATGLKYLDHLVWISAIACSLCYFFYVILSHDHIHYLKINKNQSEISKSGSIKDKIHGNFLLRNFFQLLLTIDGHSLYYFLILPLGKQYAISIFFYFSFLSILRSIQLIKILKKIEK